MILVAGGITKLSKHARGFVNSFQFCRHMFSVHEVMFIIIRVHCLSTEKKKKKTLSPYCKRMNQDVFKPVLEQVTLKNKLSSIMFNRSLFKTTTRKEINSMSCFKPVPYI